MKKLFLIGMLLSLAVSVFAQGTKGPMYYSKELDRWVYENNTDSTDSRFNGRQCFGDGAPFSAFGASGTTPTLALSTTNRTFYYRVQNTGGGTTTFNGILTLDYRMLFSDSLKYWFGGRAGANDTCAMLITGRTTGAGSLVCSLFVFNYGGGLTDTLFRFAGRTTNTGGVPDTLPVTFETACKDSNGMWPIKFSNGYFMPCVYYQIKCVTTATGSQYDLYSFRFLTDWRAH